MKRQHLQRKFVRGDRNTPLDLLNVAPEMTLPQARLRKCNSRITLLLGKLEHPLCTLPREQTTRPRSIELVICSKNNNEIQLSNMN